MNTIVHYSNNCYLIIYKIIKNKMKDYTVYYIYNGVFVSEKPQTSLKILTFLQDSGLSKSWRRDHETSIVPWKGVE